MKNLDLQRFELTGYLSKFENFSETDFFELNRQMLLEKYGYENDVQLQLLAMLAKQVSLYTQSMRDLRMSGTVITFNNGVTLGPNPHISIADKSLNRIIQILKELRLIETEKVDVDLGSERSFCVNKFLKGPLAA